MDRAQGESKVARVDGKIVHLDEKESEARRQRVVATLRHEIALAKGQAEAGKEVHAEHMEETRGVVGTVSDWVSDVVPPHVGMWNAPLQQLAIASERVHEGNLWGAYIHYEHGRRALDEARAQWRKYRDRSAGGAGEIATTLTYVRDAALALEVGLATFGAAYFVAGGGALAAGGAALLGVDAAADIASRREGPLGDNVRGTLDEVARRGLLENLRLAVHGLGGMLVGTTEGLAAIANSMLTLFVDPQRFFEDLLSLPESMAQLYANRSLLWEYLEGLPPEEQAFAVGKLAGNIEAMLISIKATQDLGGAFKDLLGGAAGGGVGLGGGQGGLGALTLQLEAFQVEAVALAAGQAVTTTAVVGNTLALPHAFAMGIENPGLDDAARAAPNQAHGKTPSKAAAQTPASKAAKGDVGYRRVTPATRAWLAKHGLEDKAIASLGSAGDDIVEAFNTLHDVPGFDRVARDYLAGGGFQEGSRFVLRWARREVAADPSIKSKLLFELKRGALGGTEVRRVDVWWGGRSVELKSWTLETFTKSTKKLRWQFIKDIALSSSDPKKVVWLFDGAKIGMSEEQLVARIASILQEEASFVSSYPRLSEWLSELPNIVKVANVRP